MIAKDLSVSDAPLEVFNEVKLLGGKVHYLINNAGFGDYGMFHELDWNRTNEMIQLNMTALTYLTRLFVTDMVASRYGKILNVASTAAFQPGPTMAVYSATKAYVLSFSEAINNEVNEKGVTVTTLCPGPTQSGFQSAAGMDKSSLFNSRKLPTSRQVALFGYDAMIKGKSVVIHRYTNYFLANLGRFAPRDMVVKIARKVLSAKH